MVPGYTDDDASAHQLGKFIQHMSNIEKVELLPYHELGLHKWKTMGYDYPLDGVPPPSKDTMDRIQNILLEYKDNVIY